jgi:hypothetical protein
MLRRKLLVLPDDFFRRSREDEIYGRSLIVGKLAYKKLPDNLLSFKLNDPLEVWGDDFGNKMPYSSRDGYLQVGQRKPL